MSGLDGITYQVGQTLVAGINNCGYVKAHDGKALMVEVRFGEPDCWCGNKSEALTEREAMALVRERILAARGETECLA